MARARIALVACDNGLGHVRRLVLLALALDRAGLAPVLFAPAASVRRFVARWPAATRISVSDYEAGVSAAALRSGQGGYYERVAGLPDLAGFDAVISDNLLEVLAARPDAILSGGFLWHRALAGVDEDYRAICEGLLERRRPEMMASALLSAGYLRDLTDLAELGLYAPQSSCPPPPDGLLISAGGGGELTPSLRAFVARLARQRPETFRVAVDASLIPPVGACWLQTADFGRELDFAAGLVRPGVGTVTDLLHSGGRVFCIREAGNAEMAENSASLERAGVGVDFGDRVADAYDAAVRWLASADGRRDHAGAVTGLSFRGADEAVAVIARKLGASASAHIDDAEVKHVRERRRFA